VLFSSRGTWRLVAVERDGRTLATTTVRVRAK
jgi:hypothetical protein